MLHGEPIPETRARLGVQRARAFCDLPSGLSEMLKGHLKLKECSRVWTYLTEWALISGGDPFAGTESKP